MVQHRRPPPLRLHPRQEVRQPSTQNLTEILLVMAEYTKFQQNAIKNFYDNRDSIALQRVQELVTELYLSEGKKLQKNWDSVILHLSKLNVDKKTLDHLRKEAK